MDHEAYENEMMDAVNRHKEEVNKMTQVKWNKNDTRVVVRGIKRTLIALLNAAAFAISVLCFITTATVTGYWAVLMFFVGLLTLAAAFMLLYAQGIIRVESQGEGK
jgi:1,4-dihydroxy-2-naphthoate octaprenyltransferase